MERRGGDRKRKRVRFDDDDEDTLKHLEEIAENTRGRVGYQLIVSGNTSSIVTVFDQPIKLNPRKQYELALLNLETYNSCPNINKTNNKLRFRTDDKSEWKMVEIPVGSYEIKAISTVITTQVGSNNIILLPNVNTLKSILSIKGTYEVDFNITNSIRTVLGFNAQIYKPGIHTSENSVNIVQINSILVHTDIITSTYQDGKIAPIIYSFFPNVPPGYKIVTVQQNLVYAPVTVDTIYRMTTWLTDQDNNKLDLRGERLTVRYHLREQ